jgi:tetratricopeptide (TPR) repeat protein
LTGGKGWLKAFWRARKADPGERDPEAAFNLGTRLEEQGDIDGAREAYRQVANSGHPEYGPVAARSLGHLNERLHRQRQAHAAYQVAIDSGHPDVAPRAMVDLGNLISTSLYPETARPFYQMAIDSGHPEAAPEAARRLARLPGPPGGTVRPSRSLIPNGPGLTPSASRRAGPGSGRPRP